MHVFLCESGDLIDKTVSDGGDVSGEQPVLNGNNDADHGMSSFILTKDLQEGELFFSRREFDRSNCGDYACKSHERDRRFGDIENH